MRQWPQQQSPVPTAPTAGSSVPLLLRQFDVSQDAGPVAIGVLLLGPTSLVPRAHVTLVQGKHADGCRPMLGPGHVLIPYTMMRLDEHAIRLQRAVPAADELPSISAPGLRLRALGQEPLAGRRHAGVARRQLANTAGRRYAAQGCPIPFRGMVAAPDLPNRTPCIGNPAQTTLRRACWQVLDRASMRTNQFRAGPHTAEGDDGIREAVELGAHRFHQVAHHSMARPIGGKGHAPRTASARNHLALPGAPLPAPA